MKFQLKNPLLQSIFLTVLFYQIAALSIYLLNEFSPSGSCTIGLGLLGLALLPLVSFVLLTIDIISVIKGNKTNRISASIHLVFLLGFFGYFWWQSRIMSKSQAFDGSGQPRSGDMLVATPGLSVPSREAATPPAPGRCRFLWFKQGQAHNFCHNFGRFGRRQK